MEDLPEEVFRAKGLLWFKGYESRFVFHWSGTRFNVEEEDWPEKVEKTNQLVVIGRKMDKKLITEMLENCITRPDDPDEDEFGEIDYGMEEEGEMGEYQNGNGAPVYGMPPQMQPVQPVGDPQLMGNQAMELAALNPTGAPVEGAVQLPKINMLAGNGVPPVAEGDTTMVPANKLPAVSSLVPNAPGMVTNNAIAQPAQSEGNGEVKKVE